MYFITVREETASKCLEVSLNNIPPSPVEGWPITEVTEFVSHKEAVKVLLTTAKDFKRYNASVDPDHIPRTKRATV